MYSLKQNEIESYTVWTIVGILALIILVILYVVFKQFVCNRNTEENQNGQLVPIAPLNVVA